MPTASELHSEVAGILATKWRRRAGQIVPEAEDVTLGNDSVSLQGTVLYADLADSTRLVNGFKDWFAAAVYKSFLVTACRIIREYNGVITAFDGDRVMGVFLGENKNSAAVQSALKINWAVKRVVNPAIQKTYPNTAYVVDHAVGIDTSELLVAKTGIRRSNDLVWVGRAANYAAKLSALREVGYPTLITEDVYKNLGDSTKYGGDPRRDMWERRTWTAMNSTVYRSNWYWEIS